MKYKKNTARGKYNVVVYNDDHNTIQHVTACIFDICGHNLLQAEQCTHLIHHVNLCTEVYEELIKEGLTVKLLK